MSLRYEDSDPAESLETFRVLRRDNLRLLERATPEDLQRVGVHSERDEESVAYERQGRQNPAIVIFPHDAKNQEGD